jgi:transcriptional regulator with XRE-family HTH domain
MGTSFPTGKKILLGREIAYMISQAGSNQAQAAAFIETSPARMAGLIKGQGTISVGDLERLANKLGVTDKDYIEVLQDLRRDNHRRGFWTTGYRRAYAEDVRLLVTLEELAEELRSVDIEVMPGLVQCESYIRAIHEHPEEDKHDPHCVTTDDSVQARLARQEVLKRDNGPMFSAVLSESALRRVYGSREVMLEQLEYLMEVAKRPNLQIQVMPFEITPPRMSMAYHYVLLTVPSPGAAGPLHMAYVESEGSDIRYLDDKKAFAARDSGWRRLTATALNPTDSVKFMEEVARSFRRKTFKH